MSKAYFVPCEIVDRCLTPKGHCDLVKALMAGAERQPLAMVRILRSAWVVRFDFKEPVQTADGLMHALQLTLAVHPEGRLG